MKDDRDDALGKLSGLQQSLSFQEKSNLALSNTVERLKTENAKLIEKMEDSEVNHAKVVEQLRSDLGSACSSITRPEDIPPDILRIAIASWLQSKGFKPTARYLFGYYMARGYARCHIDILRLLPGFDIQQLRFDYRERFRTNGKTLLQAPPNFPSVYLADDALPDGRVDVMLAYTQSHLFLDEVPNTNSVL